MAINRIKIIGGVRYTIGDDGHTLTPLEDSPTPKSPPHPANHDGSSPYAALQHQAQRLLNEYKLDLERSERATRNHKRQMVNEARKQGCIIGFLWSFTAALFGALLAPRRRRSYRGQRR